MKVAIFLLFFILLSWDQVGYASNISQWFENCQHLATCGGFPPVGFPFWGGRLRPSECGYPHLQIRCDDGFTPTMVIGGMEYKLLFVNELDKIIQVTRKDYSTNGICPKSFVNTSINYNEFHYSPGILNLTVLYGCEAPKSRLLGQFSCKIQGVPRDVGYYVEGVVNPADLGCNLSVIVQSYSAPQILHIGLKKVFQQGFKLNYTLHNDDEAFCKICEGQSSNGTCGFDNRRHKTVCVCPYGSVDTFCGYTLPPSTQGEKKYSKHHKLNLMIIGLCVGIGGGVMVGLAIYITFFLRKRHQAPSTSSSTEASSQPLQQVQQLAPSRPSPNSILEGANTLDITLFDYDELVQATDNFDIKRELGDGAFATVYYGKLYDGREVAVKRFHKHKENDRQMEVYMNEVRVLADLRHENLVVLLGCTSRQSKEIMLVYEFIPNGTVDDHLHGKFSQTTKLSWPLRVKIAVETAEGLLFLHQHEVIHRDVKTSNILLDNHFQVKVADFGLARAFPRDVSHLLTDPQGTPGYVDPQYFKDYHLSEKSDVFSFGVVLIELISSKTALDITRKKKDIKLSTMALDIIQQGEMDRLVDPSLRYGVDRIITQSVDSVAQLAFRCLQDDADMRPEMAEVLESLKEAHKQLNEYEATTSSSATTSH